MLPFPVVPMAVCIVVAAALFCGYLFAYMVVLPGPNDHQPSRRAWIACLTLWFSTAIATVVTAWSAWCKS